MTEIEALQQAGIQLQLTAKREDLKNLRIATQGTQKSFDNLSETLLKRAGYEIVEKDGGGSCFIKRKGEDMALLFEMSPEMLILSLAPAVNLELPRGVQGSLEVIPGKSLALSGMNQGGLRKQATVLTGHTLSGLQERRFFVSPKIEHSFGFNTAEVTNEHLESADPKSGNIRRSSGGQNSGLIDWSWFEDSQFPRGTKAI